MHTRTHSLTLSLAQKRLERLMMFYMYTKSVPNSLIPGIRFGPDDGQKHTGSRFLKKNVKFTNFFFNYIVYF